MDDGTVGCGRRLAQTTKLGPGRDNLVASAGHREFGADLRTSGESSEIPTDHGNDDRFDAPGAASDILLFSSGMDWNRCVGPDRARCSVVSDYTEEGVSRLRALRNEHTARHSISPEFRWHLTSAFWLSPD